jgi:hypothetical protein
MTLGDGYAVVERVWPLGYTGLALNNGDLTR